MRRRDKERFLDVAVRLVPRIVNGAGLEASTCVTQSMILIDLLREEGIRAEPWPVRLVAYPPPGMLTPDGDEYVRRIGFHRLQGGEYDEDVNWDGHLGVLVERRWYADPSIGQLNKNDGGPVPAEPFYAEVPREFVRREATVDMTFDNGVRLVVTPTTDRSFIDEHWRRSPLIARELRRRVRAAL